MLHDCVGVELQATAACSPFAPVGPASASALLKVQSGLETCTTLCSPRANVNTCQS
jgi:hypothetical protein